MTVFLYHQTIGLWVSHLGLFSNFFLFILSYFFYILDVAARVCRLPDSYHGQTIPESGSQKRQHHQYL
jgi:hypothetical protein